MTEQSATATTRQEVRNQVIAGAIRGAIAFVVQWMLQHAL